MGLKLNTRYKTKDGEIRMVLDKGKLVIHSRFNVCRLDIRKVRKHGLLCYLWHIGTIAQRNGNKAAVNKYNALQLIVLSIKAGHCTATPIKISGVRAV